MLSVTLVIHMPQLPQGLTIKIPQIKDNIYSGPNNPGAASFDL